MQEVRRQSRHYCCSSLPPIHPPALQHKSGLNSCLASRLKATAAKPGRGRAEPGQPWKPKNNVWEANRYTSLWGTEAGWAESGLVEEDGK